MSDHEYSQGIMTGEGAVVLKNGIPLSIDEIVMELNELQAARQATASGEVEPVVLRHALQRVDPLSHNSFESLLEDMVKHGITVSAHPPAKVPGGE